MSGDDQATRAKRTLRCDLSEFEKEARRDELGAVAVDINTWGKKIAALTKRTTDLAEDIACFRPMTAARRDREEILAKVLLEKREVAIRKKGAERRRDELVEMLARGWEEREVEVRITRSGAGVTVVRVDTGEVLGEAADGEGVT